MALHIDDVLGHHRARAGGITALYRLENIAMVLHHSAAHLDAAF
jgi:hypothetical protein